MEALSSILNPMTPLADVINDPLAMHNVTT
jgi:hypothetical protein